MILNNYFRFEMSQLLYIQLIYTKLSSSEIISIEEDYSLQGWHFIYKHLSCYLSFWLTCCHVSFSYTVSIIQNTKSLINWLKRSIPDFHTNNLHFCLPSWICNWSYNCNSLLGYELNFVYILQMFQTKLIV